MKQLTLSVSPREGVGRTASRRMRKDGHIPAILYGKSGARCLCIPENNFRNLMRSIGGTAALIEIEEKGQKSALSILKEVQRHSLNDRFLHVDFMEISPNEEMRMTIPVRLKGESYGVKNENGVLELLKHNLEVRCLPKDLPDFIEVDVTELHVGDAVHVRDLPKLAGVVYAGSPDLVIASCSAAKTEEEKPAEEAAAGAEGAAATPEAGDKESEDKKEGDKGGKK